MWWRKRRTEEQIIDEAIHARHDDTIPQLVKQFHQAMEDLKRLNPKESVDFFDQHVIVPFYVARITTLTKMPVSKELTTSIRQSRMQDR